MRRRFGFGKRGFAVGGRAKKKKRVCCVVGKGASFSCPWDCREMNELKRKRN